MRNIFTSLLLVAICSFSWINTGYSQVQVKFGTADAEITDWTYSISPDPQGLKNGDKFTVTFKGHVKEAGWHLYSTQEAPAGLGYNATKYEIYSDESCGIEISGALREMQKPYVMWDDIMRDSVRYFKEHDVSFSVDFRLTDDLFTLTGELSYQICVNPEEGGQCRFISVPFEVSSRGFNCQTAAPAENGNGSIEPVDSVAGGMSCNCLEDYRVDKKGNIVPKDPPLNEEGLPGSSKPLMEKVKEQKEIRESEVTADGKKKKRKGEKSLWVMFLTSFLFGFAAVLTPCVFPMIPLTVTFFTKQSGDRKKGIRNALLYGFFIIFIYSALGIIVSLLFGDEFLYLMSINPWVNLGFFILLFVFALSFLGMFEITLPSSWVNKIDKQSDRGGMIGIFFMALTLAVVSFSCTGPLVGTALIEAAGGNIWGPVVSMVGFSSALAIPFMIFAIFPGWMNSMPKSGGWLNSVKVVLGFLELALGLKFLSQTDLVLKWHILDREIFLGAWIVLAAMTGLYLIGKIRLPHDSPADKIGVPRMMLAIVSFWFMIYLFPGLWGAKLQFVSGILPPPNPDIGVKILGKKEMNEGTLNGLVCEMDNRKYFDIFEVKEHSGFCTFYDLEEGIQFARKVNRPIFLDFTGHTCANCRMMEQSVWSKPEIANVLKRNYVMISLYVDEELKLDEPIEIGGQKRRKVGQKWLGIEKELYGTIAQPYYGVVDMELNNLTEPRGFDMNVADYKQFLEDGIKAYEAQYGPPVK